MMPEAPLRRGECGGLVPDGPGWFVLNVADAVWRESPEFGQWAPFEGTAKFEHLGVNVSVLAPGQASCRYHRENLGEAFLVLEGEARLIVEGQERLLRRLDFFHCPAGTDHVFVGAGSGPCAILMFGARSPEQRAHYPVDPTAARYGASVATATDSPKEAYAGTGPSREIPRPWPAPIPPAAPSE
jgi:uncharacterized cupin superfamily protein